MNAASQTRVVASSLCALLDGLIDYAGLFPPASLEMKTAVEKYAQYLSSDMRWALGRFVLPVHRLDEFKREQLALITPELESTVLLTLLDGFEGLAHSFGKAAQGKSEHFPWRLSAILGNDVEADINLILSFNARNSGKAIIDAVEIKASTIDEIRRARPLIPSDVTPYFEISADSGPEIFHMLKAVNARAKIRTGGVVETAFPAAEQVAQFIVRCADEKLAFKATAGLHHPLRCVKPLTYASNAPTGTMHGFLNLFLAACAYRELREQVNLATLLAILLNDVPAQFAFREDRVILNVGRRSGNELSISTSAIRRARESFAISFGSCSFEEPIEDLRSFHLL